MRASEREILLPWTSAFSTVFGEDLSLESLPEQKSETPEDTGVINFPDVIRPIYLIGGTGHFSHVPRMAEYVQSLGFKWNEEGRLCAAPTPHTFDWLMESRGMEAGYQMIYTEADDDTIPIGAWLTLYLDGKIPIHVRSSVGYENWLKGYVRETHKEGFSFHISSLLHDLTVHMLNCHLVPRSWIESTRKRIEEAMPERVAEWKREGSSGPLTMTFFFDNDLNQYAMQVWCRCQKPEDYEELFLAPQNIKLLDEALELRIAQTLDGIGDVASGDTNDAQGISPLKIQLP